MGAWIEISANIISASSTSVAPFVGAWIEIGCCQGQTERKSSLPSWERGLKYSYSWKYDGTTRSLPSWERGLKYIGSDLSTGSAFVAPFVGAWIEMIKDSEYEGASDGRSLRGSVD